MELAPFYHQNLDHNELSQDKVAGHQAYNHDEHTNRHRSHYIYKLPKYNRPININL